MSTEPANTRGRIVKATEAQGRVAPLYPPTRLVPRSADQAEAVLAAVRDEAERIREESRAILEEARAHAATAVQAARDQAEELRRIAREGAHAEVSVELRQLLRSIDAEFVSTREAVAAEVQRVAFRFARAVLDVEFAVKPERIVDLVKRALRSAARFERVQVSVHPANTAFLERARAQLEAELTCEIVITGEPEIESTGARLNTEMGTFWAGISDQLRPLRDHLGVLDEGVSS